MDKIIAFLREFNGYTVVIRLVLAFACGGLIGMERGRRGRAAGFRTHILVCLGAAMAAMTGLFVPQVLGIDSDPARIASQVISGIGFLGVGTILITGRSHVTGLTTAAGLWTTAAIGLALGMGFYLGALVCTLISVLAIVFLNKFENRVLNRKSSNLELYIEVCDAAKVNGVMQQLTSGYNLGTAEIKPARSAITGNLAIEAVIKLHKGENRRAICDGIAAIDGVAFAIEST